MTRPNPSRRSARERALGLLSRREHARGELEEKLQLAGIGIDERNRELDRLEAEGLLSDARFAEVYVYSRRDRGYGPLKIAAELRRRGVSDVLINNELSKYSDKWLEVATIQYRKRWAEDAVMDIKERARRARFLSSRGFPEEIVSRVLKDPA